MDIFKGAMDTYGTQISVIHSSMGSPNSLTQQFIEKYTHEIYVPEKGIGKYDKIDWQQNHKGWQPKRKKTWIDIFEFDEIPLDVYKQYDEHRMSLVDQLNQLIKDAMVDSESYRLLRRLDDKDLDFLRTLRDKNVPVTWNFVDENKYNESAKRCTARSLIVPVRKKGVTTRYYDLTDFGLEILRLAEVKEQA